MGYPPTSHTTTSLRGAFSAAISAKQDSLQVVQYQQMDRYSYVYLLTNKNNSVIYTGVTTGLIKRISQHKNKQTPGFSSRYNLDKLVYYEVFESVTEAIKREKQIKAGSRKDKLNLIKTTNPEFEDLYHKLI